MIIITCRKIRLVNIDHYEIIQGSHPANAFYITATSGGSYVTIGEYDSRENAQKAIQALDYLMAEGSCKMFHAENLISQYNAMQQNKF